MELLSLVRTLSSVRCTLSFEDRTLTLALPKRQNGGGLERLVEGMISGAYSRYDCRETGISLVSESGVLKITMGCGTCSLSWTVPVQSALASLIQCTRAIRSEEAHCTPGYYSRHLWLNDHYPHPHLTDYTVVSVCSWAGVYFTLSIPLTREAYYRWYKIRDCALYSLPLGGLVGGDTGFFGSWSEEDQYFTGLGPDGTVYSQYQMGLEEVIPFLHSLVHVLSRLPLVEN